MSRVRLHVDHPLAEEQSVPLARDQAHYLFGVMRLRPGQDVFLFNGTDGEWRAEVQQAGKRGGTLVCRQNTAPLRLPPDVWLVFAPIKKTRTDFIVEKAAELGVRRLLPVQTDFTNSERVRRDRLQAHVVEAAEQCGGTFVPEVEEMGRLDRLLDTWPSERHLLFCDEAAAGASPTDFSTLPSGPWSVLIGPEGGFSDAERDRVTAMPQAHRIALGPRVLRADTAAVAALTLWQAVLGDWR